MAFWGIGWVTRRLEFVETAGEDRRLAELARAMSRRAARQPWF